MRYFKTILLALTLVGLLTACATVGKPYAEHKVTDIVLGETSKTDIQTMFGNPWRTGLESGQQTWTYAHYRYGVFSNAQTSDLVVRYNKQGKVVSYTFNRTTADLTKQEANKVAP
ncbi:MAG: hypothetical protein GX029_10190 [Pseudomonadaceae bacterium]|nr:hypothetical protein [Pseudomonadaceae bacterium]